MNIKINADGSWSVKRVALGMVGEKYFRAINIDASEWAADWDGCSFALIYRRPDGVVYPVAIEIHDNSIQWRITAADVGVAGVGALELRLLMGDTTIGKTTTVLCDVKQSITDEDSPPPEPAPEWLAAVSQQASVALQAAADAAFSAQEAKDAAANFIAGYEHNQLAAACIWDITHSLDRYPSVTVVDTGGNVVVGDVEYISESHIRIYFSHEFSGRAYLN